MRIGLVIYSSLATISGGYLYDRQLVEYLQAQGHPVQLVSLPWRNYPRHLGDNLSRRFFEQLRALSVDVLIQDELNHPSLVWINQAQLPKSIWQLTVVGSLTTDPAYIARIRSQIKTAQLADVVQLTGSLPTLALVEELQNSQLLAVPSYEGFGIVYLEAMSYGLPVIASTTGAAHEIVQHGQEGFLVAPGDAGALAQHIRTLHENRPLLCAMSHAARRRFERHPTWQVSCQRVESWLHEVARG